MTANLIEELKQHTVPEIPLLRTPKTVQILMIRQTHDYTIFRTEETREINVAVTPKSIEDHSQVTRAVFLASKQKAPETREFAATIKDYYQKYHGQTPFTTQYDSLVDQLSKTLKKKDLKTLLEQEILECEIKDSLCRTCPRCTLFGAVVTERETKIWSRWNIKHRIEYSSAFSLEPYDLVTENMTFNAVTESTQLTGQALGTTENIAPLVNFPSIVSINSPTWEELILVIKNLIKTKSYGAEGRTKGDTVNYITGIVFANEEVLTPLEYLLELSQNSLQNICETTYQIEKKYTDLAAFKDAIRLLTPQEVEEFTNYASSVQLTAEFVAKTFTDSLRFAGQVDKRSRQTST
jgi:CRISPR type I-D-associated protein Csc2